MLLDQIRQSTRNGLMFVIVVIIIVVFVVEFGAQGDGCQSSQGGPKNAATVGFNATVAIEGLVVFVSAAALWAVLNELVRRWKIDPLRLTISMV